MIHFPVRFHTLFDKLLYRTEQILSNRVSSFFVLILCTFFSTLTSLLPEHEKKEAVILHSPSVFFSGFRKGAQENPYLSSAPSLNFRLPRIFLTNLSTSSGCSAWSSDSKQTLKAMLFFPSPICSPR